MTQTDIIIVGAGLVGLTAALCAAHAGASVTLIDRADPTVALDASFDGRCSAIAQGSMNVFRALGLGDDLEAQAQPIKDILIAEGEAGYALSPLTLHFAAEDHPDGPTGYMIENRHIRAVLTRAVKASDNIQFIAPAEITATETHTGGVTVTLADKTVLSGSLLVAADGRQSRLRKSAGITVTELPYRQKSLVTVIAHEAPHNGTACELFFAGGPLALLPLTGNRSHIVWTDRPRAIDALLQLSPDHVAAELARRIGDHWGKITLDAPLMAYPLTLQLAEDYTAERLVLIGDAAHAIHPIAGQGLNLGLRDAALLADAIQQARSSGLDLGITVPDHYQTGRRFDNHMMGAATDILNRLFSNSAPPLRHARRLGMALVNRLAPARQAFAREAAGEVGNLPSMMR